LSLFMSKRARQSGGEAVKFDDRSEEDSDTSEEEDSWRRAARTRRTMLALLILDLLMFWAIRQLMGWR
jgi:hypothetical protein